MLGERTCPGANITTTMNSANGEVTCKWRPRSSASTQVKHSRWKLNLKCRPHLAFAAHGCCWAWLGFAWLQELPFGFCIHLTFVEIGLETHTRLEHGRRACVTVQVGSAPPEPPLLLSPTTHANSIPYPIAFYSYLAMLMTCCISSIFAINLLKLAITASSSCATF